MIVIIVFFLLKILNYGVFQLAINDEVLSVKLDTMFQILDFLCVITILFVFRPRLWPNYFTLGISDLESNDRLNDSLLATIRTNMPPIYTTVLSEKHLNATPEVLYQSQQITNAPILILNPTEYS